MNLRQAKTTLAKKVWDAAGMAGGDFAPKWVGQGIPVDLDGSPRYRSRKNQNLNLSKTTRV